MAINKLIKVQAKRRVRFQGERMIPGDFYEMTPQDVQVYANDIRISKPRVEDKGVVKPISAMVDMKSTKADIMEVLDSRDVSYDESMTKRQLLELL